MPIASFRSRLRSISRCKRKHTLSSRSYDAAKDCRITLIVVFAHDHGPDDDDSGLSLLVQPGSTRNQRCIMSVLKDWVSLALPPYDRWPQH